MSRAWPLPVAVGCLLMLGGGCTSEEAPSTPPAQPSAPSPASLPATPLTPEARQRLAAAASLSQQGEYASALAAAAQALELAPGATEAYRLISKLHTDIGRDVEAIDFFAGWAERHPGRAQPFFFKGFHEYHLGRWQDAIGSFAEASRLDPDNAEAYARRGLILEYMGRFDEALDAFEIAHRLRSTAVNAVRLADALRQHGDYEGAARVLSGALETAPDSADLQYALAQLALRDERTAEAERHLRRALELAPDQAKAHRALAGVLFRRGIVEEGERELALAERLNDFVRRKSFLMARIGQQPGDPLLPLLMAELELTDGRPDQAARWYRRAGTLGAPADRIRAGQAELLVRAGRYEEARQQLTGLGERDPRGALARCALLLQGGDVDAALALLDDALALGPRERDFMRRASDLYSRAGRHDRALELLRQAVAVPRVATS